MSACAGHGWRAAADHERGAAEWQQHSIGQCLTQVAIKRALAAGRRCSRAGGVEGAAVLKHRPVWEASTGGRQQGGSDCLRPRGKPLAERDGAAGHRDCRVLGACRVQCWDGDLQERRQPKGRLGRCSGGGLRPFSCIGFRGARRWACA